MLPCQVYDDWPVVVPNSMDVDQDQQVLPHVVRLRVVVKVAALLNADVPRETNQQG
jgi:hypothetical protein